MKQPADTGHAAEQRADIATWRPLVGPWGQTLTPTRAPLPSQSPQYMCARGCGEQERVRSCHRARGQRWTGRPAFARGWGWPQVEYPPDDIAKSFKAFAKNAPDGLCRRLQLSAPVARAVPSLGRLGVPARVRCMSECLVKRHAALEGHAAQGLDVPARKASGSLVRQPRSGTRFAPQRCCASPSPLDRCNPGGPGCFVKRASHVALSLVTVEQISEDPHACPPVYISRSHGQRRPDK